MVGFPLRRHAALLAVLALMLPLSGCMTLPLNEGGSGSQSVRASALYRARTGDTVDSVSSFYDVPSSELARANRLDQRGSLKVGQILRIPGGRKSLSTAKLWGSRKSDDGGLADASAVIGKAGCPTRQPHETLPALLRNGNSILPGNTVASQTGRVDTGFVRYDVVCNAGQQGRGGMCWPVSGCVTRPFDTRINHKGIDVCAPEGTPITAAKDGRVLYSDDGLAGFGNMIIVDHGGGIATVYAHNSRNLAKRGDKVRRGQVIAEVGMTGRASAPHLHFEVRKDGVPTDPIAYLP